MVEVWTGFDTELAVWVSGANVPRIDGELYVICQGRGDLALGDIRRRAGLPGSVTLDDMSELR